MRHESVRVLLPMMLALASCATASPRLEIYEAPQWALFVRKASFPGPCEVYITHKEQYEGPFEEEAFAARLRASIPAEWSDGDGVTLHCSDGLLVVRGAESTHRAVVEYLKTHATEP